MLLIYDLINTDFLSWRSVDMITGLFETCKDLPKPNLIVLIKQLAYTVVCHAQSDLSHLCKFKSDHKEFTLLSFYQAKPDS